MIRNSSRKHRISPIPYHSSLAVISAVCFLSACSSTSHNVVESSSLNKPIGQTALIPDSISDPYEPMNRGVWLLNKGLLKTIIHPSSRVYRAAIPEPVRGSINKFGYNITYPGRLMNNALQGRWEGAGDETLRFLCNTTVGVGGFFDPATKWNIDKSNANFSQTFGKWGWKPGTYVMLPFFGPSDERHLTGLVADRAAEPWSYTQPYQAASQVATYNRVSDLSEDARRLIEMDPDAYSFVKYAWTYGTKDDLPDFKSSGKIDLSTLQTIGATAFRPENPEFITETKEISIRIPTTGCKLKFNYWIQPEPAPVVYISPGLSSHRLSMMSTALAEYLYKNGFSVVSSTSVFHPDFMNHASTADLPVYPPVDSKDLLVALTEMDRTLAEKYPQRLTKRALLGLSMGGFMTINIAVNEEQAKPELMTFDRYIAIDSPVDIQNGVQVVDSFINAPLAWPEADRQTRVNNTVHKATISGLLVKKTKMPVMFDEVESKYLIGLAFRVGLRDIIFESQRRNNREVLDSPLSKWSRETAYEEIMNYSYKDYFLKFAAPYYEEKGVSMDELLRHSNLRIHESKLRRQSRLRILVNKNDFLLPAEDLSWLETTIPKSRLTVVPNGGHLGNLNDPVVEKAILKSLDGLR